MNQDNLQAQLTTLHNGTDKPVTGLKSIVAYLKFLDAVGMEYYSEVIKVVKLILMPATNTFSERSFSALRSQNLATCKHGSKPAELVHDSIRMSIK